MSDVSIQLAGSLLLASPALRDGIFDRSVILLSEHGLKEGAYGLILNQPTGREVAQFLQQPEFEPLARVPVHMGGPVSQDQLTFASFSKGKKGQLKFNLRLPAEEAIAQLKRPGVVVRAFIGYSGWSAGQLEGELKRQAWIPLQPNASLPGMPHDSSLWTELLQGISPFHRLMANAPRDPDLN